MAEVTHRPAEGRDQDVAQQPYDVEALLRVARARFTQASEAETTYRLKAQESLAFLTGEQWDPTLQQRRELEQRPCLTINRCPQFVRQITNNQRINRPSLKVSPVDDSADPETADVIQGLLRHTWQNSDADMALDTANEAAATHGRGFYRVLLDYEDPWSFDLELKVSRIRNALAVYPDPVATSPDGSDYTYCFVVERMQRDIFLTLYPADIEGNHITPTNLDNWSRNGDSWVQANTVQVAEYFYVHHERAMICQVVTTAPDGTLTIGPVQRRSELPDPLPDTMQILRERESILPTIYWAKINGYALLEHQEWPGRWIPIIPVLGNEVDVNGKVVYSGVVEELKDAQRQYNYWTSAITEAIAVAPRAPWVMGHGQNEGHEEEWATANTEPHAYLVYAPVTVEGTLLPPPQRNIAEPAIQAMTQALMLAAEDMKATSGIYDASLGQRSNETSGIGIQRRQQQTDVANFHYADNATRSIKQLGRVLIDLLPHAFADEGRVARILGEDDSERQVRLNETYTDEGGYERLYDVRVGKYDVRVDAGPNYATKRQEATDTMSQLVQAYPDLMKVAGHLVVKGMDIPYAEELHDLLKAMLPPELQAITSAEKGDPKQQVQLLQAQMQQTQQQLAQLNAYGQQQEQLNAQLQQENESLKRGEAMKQQELVLRSRENDQRHAEKVQELALKEEELRRKDAVSQEDLALKAEKNDLEALRIRLEHVEAMAAAKNGTGENEA